MSSIRTGHQELEELLSSKEATKPLLYIVDTGGKEQTLQATLESIPLLSEFEVVSLDPFEDYDVVYSLRRAARRLLQGPDAFPLYLFANSDGLPFYCVTAPPPQDLEHQVGLETHTKKVLAALNETPDEVQARVATLSGALQATPTRSGPVHGQLVKRAFESWNQDNASPAQCLGALRISKRYPQFAKLAIDLWHATWRRTPKTNPLSPQTLSLLSAIPSEPAPDFDDLVSQIETELTETLSAGSEISITRGTRCMQALHALKPQAEVLGKAAITLKSTFKDSPPETWRFAHICHTLQVHTLLDSALLDALEAEFLRRTDFNSSVTRTTSPIPDFESVHQECWDAYEPDLFVYTCLGLATRRKELRDGMVTLLEAHSENLNAEPRFYPTLLSLLVEVLAEGDTALEEITSQKPLPGKAEKEAQNAQINTMAFDGRLWPGTELMSAPLGMGTLRLPKETGASLLQEAWDLGVRTFDVGPHFAGGLAEQLVGQLLHRNARTHSQARQETTVITRLGLVSSSLRPEWDKCKKESHIEKSSVSYQGSTLCLDPQWLDRSLSESRNQLGLECIDVALLAQPELFLLEARERNAKYRDLLDEELEKLLLSAFEFLEEQCRLGRIQYYGVVSGTLGHHGDAVEHLSPELIVRAATTAGGPNHRCRVVQAPLNLLETGLLDWQNASAKSSDPVSAAEFFAQNNITVLSHRPLNASQGAKLHRFAPLPSPSKEVDFQTALGTLKEVESTLRDAFNLPIRMGENEISLADLFHFADELEEAVPELGGIAEWEHLHQTMISPRMKRLLQFMDQLPDPEEAKAFAVIRPTWLESYDACLDATFQKMRNRTATIHDTFREAYLPMVDPIFADHPGNSALSLLVDVPIVSATLPGPIYSDDLQAWPALMRRSQKPNASKHIFEFGERVQSLMMG